jgi:hypothetical protein
MKQLTAFASLALAACTTVPLADAGANAGPTAGLGQVAAINGLRVRPIEVVEDSRCPANVQCVWAGRLIVRARMNGNGWTQVRDFELGAFQAVDQYRVTLIHAEPPKTVPGPTDPRAYRFTFEVQSGI